MMYIDLTVWLFTKQKTYKSPISQSLKVIINRPAAWAQRLIKQCKLIIKINNVGFKNENSPNNIPLFLWIKDVTQLIHI